MQKLGCIVLLVTLAAPAASVAQVPTDEQRAACQADYIRFCVGLLPGEGRIAACLRQHYAELSDACKKMVDAAPK